MKLKRIQAAAKPYRSPIIFTVPVTIEAAASDGAIPPFSMVAYSGGLLKVKGFPHPVVVDLAGLSGIDKPRPVLKDHNHSATVGHTESIVNDGRSLMASGLISGTGAAAKEVRDSAKNNFPWQASIGADPLQCRLIPAGQKATVNGQTFNGPVIVATRSLLREISFVAVGADDNTSARIAANAAEGVPMDFTQWLAAMGLIAADLKPEQLSKLQAKFDAESNPPEPTDDESEGDDAVKRIRAAHAAELTRIAAIETACKGKFPAIQAQAISENWDAKRTELEVKLAELPKAPAAHVKDNTVSGAVIEAALCMSLGLPDLEKQYKPEVLEAAHSKRHIGLQEALMITATANGYSGHPGERINQSNLRDVLEFAFPRRGQRIEAANSTVSLPGIFSNVANKELLTGYMEEDQTWREISQVKSVNDFKSVTSYRLLDNMEYEELGPDGEIKHGSVSEESYTRQAKTYAKMFGLDRRDIINDDLSAFDDLRRRLGAGAAKKFNNVFWAKFMDNSSFFTTGRVNYITGSTTTLLVDGVGLQLAITAFRKLRSPAADGSKRVGNVIGGRPEILLVPPELEFAAQRLYQSTNVNTGGSSSAESVGNANIHAGKYRPVICNWLSDANFTGYSATAWYLLRAPSNLPPVVASFLNGQQSPTVESTDADFDHLGIQFRGYHDFGVDQAEYLCGIKSKGAA